MAEIVGTTLVLGVLTYIYFAVSRRRRYAARWRDWWRRRSEL